MFFGRLGDPELFLRCRAHPFCMHAMACLTLFSYLAAWFGCSWVGLGRFGGFGAGLGLGLGALGLVWGPRGGSGGASGVLGGPDGVLGALFFLL